jgi:ABC-type sugar transport system substrate-binding protein
VQHSAEAWGVHPFASISTDHIDIGRLQAHQVNRLLPQGGITVVVTSPQRSSAAQERLAGMREELAAGIEALDAQAGEGHDGIVPNVCEAPAVAVGAVVRVQGGCHESARLA